MSQQDGILKKNLLREEFGIKDDVPILLYQGGLTEERGIFTMVDIMANLHGVALVFMGMGRDKNRLQQYVIKKECISTFLLKMQLIL